MLRSTCVAFTVLCLATAGGAGEPAGKPLEGLRLLDGYTHERLRGIDSTVGKITRAGDDFEIFYEKGRIPDPNAQFRLGGDFSNGAERVPENRRAWSRKQTVAGKPVHLVLQKDDTLIVTYPKSGINFRTKIGKSSDFADALLMLLTLPEAATGD